MVKIYTDPNEIKIDNHLLVGDDFYWAETPNKGGTIVPKGLVIHDTAGRLDKLSSVKWMQNKRARASAHLCLERDGTWTQLVPFNKKAWHAGRSHYKDMKNLNSNTIGIEIVNPGKLSEKGVSWFKEDFSDLDGFQVVETPEHGKGGWLDYTEQQIVQIMSMTSKLVETYNLEFIVGHYEISPRRKVDPNPLFPLDSLRSTILGREDRDYDGYVTTNLNVRTLPSLNSEIVTTLIKGTEIEIIAVYNEWYVIDYGFQHYFVYGKFVKEY